MRLVERTGFCRACGQSKIMKVPDTMTDEDLEEKATRECTCADGREYRYKKEKEEKEKLAKEQMQAWTQEIFGDNKPAVKTTLDIALDPILKGDFDEIVVKYDNTTVKLKYNSKDSEFVIEKKDTDKRKHEVSTV